MFCKNCGKKVDPESAFCQECGAVLKELDVVKKDVKDKVEETSKVDEPKKTYWDFKRKGLKRGIIVFAIILVLWILVEVILAPSQSDDEEIKYQTNDEIFVPEEESENITSDNVELKETQPKEIVFSQKIGCYEPAVAIEDGYNGRIDFVQNNDGTLNFSIYVFELDYNVFGGDVVILNENTAQYSDENMTITFSWIDSNRINVTRSGYFPGMDGGVIDEVTNNVEYQWSEEFN